MGRHRRSACDVLPAEGFFEEGDGQFSLRLQGGLIQTLQKIEQRTHAAGAASQYEVPYFVSQVQASARCT